MLDESGPSPFTYVILRLVPNLERGERLNLGVVVFCRQRRFLGARVTVDAARVRALCDAPTPAELADHLAAVIAVAEGGPAAGPLAALDQSDRFGWLAAPSSTVVQPSAVHTGLSDDPEATLDTLYVRLIAA